MDTLLLMDMLDIGHDVLCTKQHNYIRTIVAPFFTDIDIRGGVGNIEYEVHTNTTSETILSQVNELINNCSGKNFSGEWLLVTSWEDIPLFSKNPNNVSS